MFTVLLQSGRLDVVRACEGVDRVRDARLVRDDLVDAGTDRDHMQDFRNPDDTLRNHRDIAALWRGWNIEPQHRISFYCGTGWRASEAFFAAYLMGYENISVYDGGWYEWSADENNPVDTGIPSPSHR